MLFAAYADAQVSIWSVLRSFIVVAATSLVLLGAAYVVLRDLRRAGVAAGAGYNLDPLAPTALDVPDRFGSLFAALTPGRPGLFGENPHAGVDGSPSS